MEKNTKLTATTARNMAKAILAECSECFDKVNAVKGFGGWRIDINGGSASCYGKTVKTFEGALDIIRVFANEAK